MFIYIYMYIIYFQIEKKNIPDNHTYFIEKYYSNIINMSDEDITKQREVYYIFFRVLRMVLKIYQDIHINFQIMILN